MKIRNVFRNFLVALGLWFFSTAAFSDSAQIWNLQDADIRAVIQTVSELTGKSFIVDPRVQGKITIVSTHPLSTGEMYQVFLSMLQILNYAAVPAGKVIKIVPVIQAKEYGGALATDLHPGSGDEIVVRIVPINNMSASQLVSVLRPLVQEWGSITAYDPANTLILASNASNINRLMTIIHTMDRKNASAIQVVRLHYANAKKLVDVLTGLQNSDRTAGKVTNVSLAADEQNNAILVSGNAIQREQIKTLIHQLDTKNSTGSANTVVIRLNYLRAKKLAPILTKIAQGKLTEQAKQKNPAASNRFGVGDTSSSDSSTSNSVSIQAEDDNNAIVISAPTGLLQSLKQIVQQLDTRPKQVLVQAIIVRVDEAVIQQLGIQWGTTNPNVSEAITVSSFPAGIGFIPHGNLQALIQMLTTHASTDILATPSVVVLNNRPAMISDGKNVGIINREYAGTGTTTTTDTSTVPFNTFERQDVTLQLKVTPQVTPDNTIRLTIDQQDDHLEPDTSSSSTNPVIDTSKIKTSVLVNSGDVLVLGGLISNDNQEHLNKVPFLGSIPLLGKLFQYKNHTGEKKNLMMFIRPAILKNRDDNNSETAHSYDYMRYQEFRKKAGLGLEVEDAPMLPSVDKEKEVDLPPPF